MNASSRLISENELQGFVMQTAKTGGWVATHFRAARSAQGYRTPLQGDAGFPDTVLVHGGLRRCIFAELKSEKGRLSPGQKQWIETLRMVPDVETYVWRPSDMQEILRVLLGHKNRRGG